MQVERQIIRQSRTVENFLDKLLIVIRHDDSVMAEPRILPVQSQVEQKTAHGVTITLHLLTCVCNIMRGWQEFKIGGCNIAISNDSIALEYCSIFQQYACCSLFLEQNLFHGIATANFASQIAQKLFHRRNEGIHPPWCVMYSSQAFKVWYHAVDGAGAERVAADEERMEGEDHAQLRVVKIARNVAIDAALRSQAYQFRSNTQEAIECEKGLFCQVNEGASINTLRCREKCAVGRDIMWLKFGDLGFILRGGTPVVKIASILETDAIERVET